MDGKQIYNQILRIFAEILQTITGRYVMNDLTIPAEVLALKDEACHITSKAADEHNPNTLAEYERRLSEIRSALK
ncbi:MAG: hypothetical protein K2N06_07715 [Oscillospiraceae bacterium]|nr:hypothetical protein [Oscillospiraceae bacterium]